MTIEELEQQLTAFIATKVAEMRNDIFLRPSVEARIDFEEFERVVLAHYSGDHPIDHTTFRLFLTKLKEVGMIAEVGVADNLTTTTEGVALSANMGKHLDEVKMNIEDATTLFENLWSSFNDLVAANSEAHALLAEELATKAPTHNPVFTGDVEGITKTMVGLGNVDNTADVDKPISIAQAAVNNTLQNEIAAIGSGDLGAVAHNGSVPTTGNAGKNGVYTFSSGGVCPWLPGTPTVKAGDKATVTYNPTTLAYTYAWINNPSEIVNDLTTGGTGKMLSAEMGYVLKVEVDKKATLSVGKNLFNKNASGIIDGKYLTTLGAENTNASYFISDYIPILPSTNYVESYFDSGAAYLCFYDANKQIIEGASYHPSSLISTFTSPAGAYFIRLSGTIAGKAIQQLELGTVATFYESYYNAITEPNVPLPIARKLDIDTLINSTPQFPRFVTGKNIFNYADSGVKRGYYLLATNVENANSTYSITGYIPVVAGQVLRCNKAVGGGAYNMFYDAFKNPILAFNSGTSPAAPTGAAYVRYSLAVTAAESISAAQVQVEVNSTSTTYEAYYSFLLDASLPPTISRRTDLLAYLQKKGGKNLFNPTDADIMVGYYISSTGTYNSNGYGYNVTGFIPISSGQTLKANWSVANTYVALYDVNKAYIPSTAVNANSITWQTGAVYARFSYNISTINNQVEVGTVSTAYEEYTEYQPVAALKAQTHDRDVQPILPAKMYFAKGKESCLYYENVLLKNMNDATTLFINKGINYNRLCQFNFAAAATSQTMTLQVLRSLKKGLLKSITYNVKDPATNNGKTINVLFIGDSFTDIGTYVKEVKTLMAVDGVTINLLGTNGNSTFKAEGLSGGTIADTFLDTSRGVAKIVQVTGMTTLPSSDYPGTFYSDSNGNQWLIRGGKISGGSGYIRVTKTSGAVVGDFATFPSSGVLTKLDGAREGDATISYSTPTAAYHNPFINPSTGLLDLPYYLSLNSFANPSIVNIQFTWNDIATWASDASIAAVVANFKTAVDHIHTSLPSAKIVLSIEPFGSLNGNLDWNGKKYSVLRFAELMIAQFETDANYSSFVVVAPSYAFVDLVNGYSSSTATPSARYAITEQSGGDGTHPTTVGMKQISDCLFQIYHNLI